MDRCEIWVGNFEAQEEHLIDSYRHDVMIQLEHKCVESAYTQTGGDLDANLRDRPNMTVFKVLRPRRSTILPGPTFK